MNKTENICILLHFVCKFEYYDNPQRRRSGLECGLQAFRWDMQVREASSMEGRGVGRAYKSDKQIKKKVILVFENTFLSLDFFGFQNKIPAFSKSPPKKSCGGQVLSPTFVSGGMCPLDPHCLRQ